MKEPEAETARRGQDEVFRPWRSELVYSVFLVISAALFFLVCRLSTGVVMESQIALGVDPGEVAKFVSLAILSEALVLAVGAARVRRVLLTSGEARLLGDSLIVSSESLSIERNLSDLSRIRCHASGANIRLRFPGGTVSLPGQWLPAGWKRTWRGWRTPAGAVVRLRRKTHPLLASLRILRPDLRPRSAGFAFELIFIVLCSLAPKIAIYPMFADMRRASDRPHVNDIAMAAFSNGQYFQSCEAYRLALPDLKHDYYGSLSAGEFLSYCGDTRGALRALTAFDGGVLEPMPLPRTALAQVRLFSGRYAEAEDLLGNTPSYPLYLAVVGQGRLADADHILESIAGKEGLAHVLLLRHRRAPAARGDAALLCSEFLTHKPWTPSWLARVFESCILMGGADKVMQDPRFEPAVLALPGLRAELVQFTDREAPEFAADLRATVERIVARQKPRGQGRDGN